MVALAVEGEAQALPQVLETRLPFRHHKATTVEAAQQGRVALVVVEGHPQQVAHQALAAKAATAAQAQHQASAVVQ